MAIDIESLKRVLGGMKTFARGERLKQLNGRLNPKATDKDKLDPKAESAGLQDDPEVMALKVDPAEEAAESPDEKALELGAEPGAEDDDEASMIKKLLAKLGE